MKNIMQVHEFSQTINNYFTSSLTLEFKDTFDKNVLFIILSLVLQRINLKYLQSCMSLYQQTCLPFFLAQAIFDLWSL